MCFSATASFAASVVLSGTGTLALHQAETKEDRFLASIPFLFAIQQFFEGLVWLFPTHGALTSVLAYAFLFFAFLLWPVYVPHVAYIHEPPGIRKDLLQGLRWIGALGSAALFLILLTNPLHVVVVQQSLCYKVDVLLPYIAEGIVLYVIVTVGSLLLSTNRFLRLFGMGALATACMAWQFYHYAFTSVWCFFAALMSVVLVLSFYLRKKKTSEITT